MEEFPGSDEKVIEEKLLEIWSKVPYEFQAKYHVKAEELKTKALELSAIKKDTVKAKEYCKPPKITKVLKPKALKFPQNKKINYQQPEEKEEEKVKCDYRNVLKETMTYNSPDKYMKHKISTKKYNNETMCLYGENEIATGYLQDILLSQQNNETDVCLDKGIETSYEYMLNNMNYDVSQLESYLQGDSSIFETSGMLPNTAEVEATIHERIERKEKQREAARLRRNELARLSRMRRRKMQNNLLDEQNDEADKRPDNALENINAVKQLVEIEKQDGKLSIKDVASYISDQQFDSIEKEEIKLPEEGVTSRDENEKNNRLLRVMEVDDLSDYILVKELNIPSTTVSITDDEKGKLNTILTEDIVEDMPGNTSIPTKTTRKRKKW